MNADNDRNPLEAIDNILKDSHLLIEESDYERAAQNLQKCLCLDPGIEQRASILDDLGYACLKLGWFEDAAKAYAEYIKIRPGDNDGRFFLASAYSSMGWADEAIKELDTILRSDPTDVLARHDLALYYRDKGWLKESLGEMRKANEYAATHGNPDEKEVVRTSLNNLEEEIESADDDTSEVISLLVLLSFVIRKRSRPKARKPWEQ